MRRNLHRIFRRDSGSRAGRRAGVGERHTFADVNSPETIWHLPGGNAQIRDEPMPSPKRIAALCLVAAACAQQGHAREPDERGGRLRIDLTYISSSTVSEDLFGETTVSDTTFGAGVTAQFPNGFYARARVSSTDTTEIEQEGFAGTFDPDERHTVGTVGIGYRFRRDGEAFWGLGLRGSAAENAEVTATASLFREKDTARRHGVIAFGYTSGEEELEVFSLTGRHVWFGAGGGIGPGVIWSAARGNAFFDENASLDEVELAGFSLGLVLMFREGPR